jgi:hypothetical protein
MAIFKITTATSRSNSAGNAFGPPADDSPSADTLIVDPGASLVAGGASGSGAVLANTGAWTVTVNGSIDSLNSTGIFLDAGNSAVSTIKIGADGEVHGGLAGLFLSSSANIINAGQITSTANAGIEMGFLGGTSTITNSGTITGFGVSILDTGGSNNTVKNSGQLFGNVVLNSGNDTVKNTGTINGNISLGDGNDTVNNTGTINANIFLGNDANSLTNSGRVAQNVIGGNGSDTVTNFAIVGDVMKSGTITGTVFLGDGNDNFTGGAKTEIVQDADGADITSLGGGNDTYIATGGTAADGIDVVKGGAGVDTYDAFPAPDTCQINLDTVAHDFSPFAPGAGLVAANTATGTNIAGAAKDTIFGFENAIGGNGQDTIYGSTANNVLDGGVGNDFLAGLGGKDTLDGGPGDDHLVGGGGKDRLTGGVGADTFHYLTLSDSGITTRDLIVDFEPGFDTIDLSAIDAIKTNAPGTNDAFEFIGTNVPFDGHAGQLHAFRTASSQIVEGDVNGDAKADFSIEIQDPTNAITLASTDFKL